MFKKLIKGFEDDLYYVSCVQQMLRHVHEVNINTQDECLEYLGEIFRSHFYQLHSWITNKEISHYILTQCILIHLDDYMDKFNLIVFMVQKLFQCVQDKSKVNFMIDRMIKCSFCILVYLVNMYAFLLD